MDWINYWSVLTAVLVSFVASSLYYVIFAQQWASSSKAGAEAAGDKHPGPLKGLSQLLRTLILAIVVTYFVHRLAISDVANALRLAAILWVGFPVLLLAGSVMWEKTPVKQAVLHAGDALLALSILTVITALWR